MSERRPSIGKRITEATPIVVLGLGLLALLADVSNWWWILLIGWLVVTPLVAIVFGEDDEDAVEVATTASTRGTDTEAAGSDSDQDALDTLRDRYARGELTEEQFERKVERLLETETVEDARERVAGRERERESGSGRERETGSGRERERESGSGRERESGSGRERRG